LTVIKPKWFGDTRARSRAARSRLVWLLCSFQGPPEAERSPWVSVFQRKRLDRPADAGLSKLNSMPAPRPRSRGRSRGIAPARFGRRARPAGRSGGPDGRAGSSGAPEGAP